MSERTHENIVSRLLIPGDLSADPSVGERGFSVETDLNWTEETFSYFLSVGYQSSVRVDRAAQEVISLA